MSYRFRELREKAGLTTAELAKRIGVSQAAASQWDTGKKFPSSETLCKLADLYCVSIDYLVGRESADPGVPVKADIIPTNTLPFMHGKPVWDETRGWGVVNAAMDYVIFMDGTKIVLAEAMNLRAMAPAYSMGYSPTAKPIFHEELNNFKAVWVKPITPDSFLQDELTGWYEVHDFYVQNQHGTRFLFDTYGTRWLAFEMEFYSNAPMNIGAFSYSANSSGRKSSIYRGTVYTIPQLFIWHMEHQQHKKRILCMYSKTYCMVIFRLFLYNAIRKKLRKGVFICTEYWN